MKMSHIAITFLEIACAIGSGVFLSASALFAQPLQEPLVRSGVGVLSGFRPPLRQDFYDHGSVQFDLRNQQIQSRSDQRNYQKNSELRLRYYTNGYRSSPPGFYDQGSVQFDLRNQQIQSRSDQHNDQARPSFNRQK